MITFLYECVLWVLALLIVPRMVFCRWFKGKYRTSFWSKFGSGFPTVEKNGRPLIWIHAVSVGETKAVSSLVNVLKYSPSRPLILFSSTTETGHAEAKKNIADADYHVYLPFDFSFIIRRSLKKASPDLMIVSETDGWYNWFRLGKKIGSQVVVVNGKISNKSASIFKKIPFFSRRLFGFVDLFCVQSDHYKNRFLEMGVDPSKIVVTGNTKLDGNYTKMSSEELKTFQRRLGLKEGEKVVVVGSSHPSEEEGLLRSLSVVWKKIPSMKVVLVPRHPERFNEVAKIVEKMGFVVQRYSQRDLPEKSASVVLVDQMGLLSKCYQVASVAIVAGSFGSKIGGHNIIEPLYYGTPLVFGPYMFSQPELLDMVLSYKAGLQVPVEKVGEQVLELLINHTINQHYSEAGIRLTEENRGATKRTYDHIRGFFEI